ncbi:uncharacterized protein HD556DRAFT_1451290 [Suillus plorans]|uniref:Uncharacterized protein n=1 Tax=Suillus plorans TaxID=116603 RepID=A0A9P7D9X0_9AGAM|nr:uncharacterized protein HD556DRAFT_1451290 [Suillus plorans]KAG1784904.1 hypothetical protein HD556DRAFT_1451290 [Suillus plorans]
MSFPKQHSITANNQALERFGFKPPTSSTRKTGATRTKARQVADQDIAEDRDFERDGDSDLQPEHDRDFNLQHNNRDEYDGASENGNQGPDDNPREDEDSQMDQNQSTGQQRNQVDGFDDDLEGGMHDFDQGIDDELNNAARQESQEGGVIDVLELHQAKNGRRKAPSQASLLRMKYSQRPHCSKSPRRPSPRRASPAQVQCRRTRSPRRRTRSPRSRSPSAHQYGHRPSVRASSSRIQSPLRRSPSRATQSSNRIWPSSQVHSSSQSFPKDTSPSDCATSPTLRGRSSSTTPEPDSCSSKTIREQKIKPTQEDPTKLGFYPPSWQAFLQAAKVEMRLQAVLSHPIPEHGDALQLAQEVLDAELWR